MQEFSVVEPDTEKVLLARVGYADRFTERFVGLMGRSELAPDEGLYFPGCSSIHMFFMSFPLDLAYFDGDRTVKKIVEGIKPWRISWCPGAHSVLEAPAGWVRRAGLGTGQQLRFSPDPEAS